MPSADEEDVKLRAEKLLAGYPPEGTEPRDFLRAQFDAGLAWVHYPPDAGGLGLDPQLQSVVNAELVRVRAPRPNMARNPIGLGMAAPTIALHSEPPERSRFLRPLFCGDEVWCQLFSEPGAGSDLAGLAARAERDGDEWVVNGQKVWTSLAHVARWGLLVARTDPSVPKHQGLTFFAVDLQADGVEIRPLRQLTGEAEFNEVYLTDVRVPDRHRLGAVGDGWRVAMTTLMHERVVIGGGRSTRGSGAIGVAVSLWNELGARPAQRDRLMALWIEAEVHRLTNLRRRAQRHRGHPGPEDSMGKLVFAELSQRIYEFCVDIMGPDGTLYGDYALRRPEQVSLVQGHPRHQFLRARANTIEGGTSEVLRNVLGERVLGIPGEPRVDRDRPWSDVPRS